MSVCCFFLLYRLFRRSLVSAAVSLPCTDVKVEKVENLANFFLDHLAFFFIPASVGLMTSFVSLKGNIFKIILLCILTTIIVIGITGITVQFICNKASIKEKDKNKLNKKGA